MSRNEMLMILITSLWAMGNTMSAVFVNVYLYAYTGSLVVMTIYCIVRIAQFPLFFTLGGKWAQRQGFAPPLTTGVIVTMLSLVYVLMMNESFASQPYLVFVVALLVGIGEGFFWLSVNSLHQIVCGPEQRARYLGNIGIFNNVANIIAPALSTWIVSHSINDTEGYVTIFKFVLVIYVVIVVSAAMVRAKSSAQKFSVLKCMPIIKDKTWRFTMIFTFMYGMRDAITLTLAGLLVYNATGGSGGIYGSLLTVFALISIVSYYIFSRRLRGKNLYRLFGIGSFLISSSTIVLVLVPNLFGAIYYGIVNAMATPLYSNPYSLIAMNNIQKYADHENMIGRVIVKEIYLSIGRCFGMFCIVMCSWVLSEKLYLPVSVIFCSLFPIFLYLYAKKHQSEQNVD
ncbi:MAG: MFS transporter [Erysipelotrichaceae bacterium]|nr:MFS transporter [Erysipelotrichaceae bacterium]